MTRDRLLLLLFSSILFLPFLGSAHLFDWDEINFAESAREMLVSGNYWQVQINYEPFWEKPPLFFWMQVACMKIFGVNEFAARLPNAICGIVTLQVLFSIGFKWQGRIFAWIWTLLYCGSILPFLYFKSGIIDPWFNLFIFLSVYHLFVVLEHPTKGTNKHAIQAGLFTGLAILTKGPVGLLLALLTFLVWLFTSRFRKKVPLPAVLLYASFSALVSFVWFGFETIKNGAWFIVEFIEYQIELFQKPVAGHKQPFFYHFVVVLLGCFPASVLAIPSFHKRFKGDSFQLSRWMKILFWVVLILFSIVSTKIVHYSSMTYIPLTYLAAAVVYELYNSEQKLPQWIKFWIGIQGLLIAIAITLLPILIYNKDMVTDLVEDPFVKGNLAAPVEWNGFEWVTGLILSAVILYAIIVTKKSTTRAFKVLTIGVAVSLTLTLTTVVPLVEAITQGSLIRFLENHQGKNVTFTPKHFKTYAHYFYGRVSPEDATASESSKKEFLIYKVQHEARLEKSGIAYKELYREGGYIFVEVLDQGS